MVGRRLALLAGVNFENFVDTAIADDSRDDEYHPDDINDDPGGIVFPYHPADIN